MIYSLNTRYCKQKTPPRRSLKKGGIELKKRISLLAGSLLQGSNPKKGKNASNQPTAKETKNSVRFTEDLIKIYEFSLNYKAEITRILEKTGIKPTQG